MADGGVLEGPGRGRGPAREVQGTTRRPHPEDQGAGSRAAQAREGPGGVGAAAALLVGHAAPRGGAARLQLLRPRRDDPGHGRDVLERVGRADRRDDHRRGVESPAARKVAGVDRAPRGGWRTSTTGWPTSGPCSPRAAGPRPREAGEGRRVPVLVFAGTRPGLERDPQGEPRQRDGSGQLGQRREELHPYDPLRPTGADDERRRCGAEARRGVARPVRQRAGVLPARRPATSYQAEDGTRCPGGEVRGPGRGAPRGGQG